MVSKELATIIFYTRVCSVSIARPFLQASCPPGFTSNVGAIACVPCAAGKQSNTNRTECDACPMGRFAGQFYLQVLEFTNYFYSYLYGSWLRKSIPVPICGGT